MKEILITGCRGQLGNEIQLLASEYPHFHFFFTDREELDITNEEQVMAFVEANKITTIINCAAFTAVDKAESEEALCDLLNHKAPGYLPLLWLRWAAKWFRFQRIMFLTVMGTSRMLKRMRLIRRRCMDARNWRAKKL